MSMDASSAAAKPALAPRPVYKKMKLMGIVLWSLGCARLFKDGESSFSVVFRPWHPLTWLIFVVMIIPCALMGEKIFDAVPMRLSNFWILNRDQLQWVTPFTDMNTLKPFVYRRIPVADAANNESE